MTQHVRNWVVATFLAALVCTHTVVALDFLPKRPDSAAFFIGLGLYFAGTILAKGVICWQRPSVVGLGKQVQMLAFGAMTVGLVLFFFGGYRAASDASEGMPKIQSTALTDGGE